MVRSRGRGIPERVSTAGGNGLDPPERALADWGRWGKPGDGRGLCGARTCQLALADNAFRAIP